MRDGSSPTIVDLFCGCGGMSAGFKNAGFLPLMGVDVLKDAVATYTENIGARALEIGIEPFVDCLRTTIDASRAQIDASDPFSSLVNGVDVIVGCPPCQGYSTLGRMSRGTDREIQHEKLNRLWKAYSDAIALLRPKVVVTENIPLFLTSPEFGRFVHSLEELGYTHVEEVLDAYTFGVPQRRKRAIMIASNVGAELSMPPPTNRRTTVRQAIGHFSKKPSGINWHVGRNVTELSLARYQVIPQGGNRFDLMRERPDLTPPCWLRKPTGTTDVFGRLFWDRPSPTIRTEFFKPEKGRYLHPEEHRPITPREAATLQSFPSTFKFVGSYTSVSRQIGEAVPPVMARAIADHVAAILSDRSACETSTTRINQRQQRLFQESLFATASSAQDAEEM